MNLFIYNQKNFLMYKKVYIINVYLENNSYSIMKNHFRTICFVKKIFFKILNKIYKISFLNGFIKNFKKIIKIICDKYEFFK